MFYRFLLVLTYCLSLTVTLAQNLKTGDILFDEGNYAGAAGVYQRVFDASGDQDGVALYKLANARVYAAGQTEGETAETLYDAAVTLAKEAVTLVPGDLEAHMALVRAWGRLGDLGECSSH